MCNERRKENLSMLTGRVHGDFLMDGRPRGGGVKVEETELVLYEATEMSAEQVVSNMGLVDGVQIDWQERHPQVNEVTVVRTTVRDEMGRLVSRDYKYKGDQKW